jgi:hypothetical protein
MSTDHIRLHIETCQDDRRGLAAVIQDAIGLHEPLLAWAEPDPRQVALDHHAGRRSDFVPLVRGQPVWPEDLPLTEARLFWPLAALHVVADADGGCRWIRIDERTTDDRDGESLMRTACSVYSLRDRQRFGLPKETAIDHLMAIEYRQRGRLVAWRLTLEEE